MKQLAQQIEDWRWRVAALQRAGELSLPQQQLKEETGEGLCTALEELQLASEELYQQNEELVSARMVAEAERQRYQELFEFAPDGYLVTDIEGILREANRAAAELLNVSQQFLVGQPLLTFIPQSERPAFRSQLNRLRQLERVQEWEVRLHPRKSRPFDAALSVTNVCDSNGKSVILRWLVRDITKRKMAEAALQQLNANLERQVQERTSQLQQALEFEAMLKCISDKVRDSLDESQILQTAVQELTLVLKVGCCHTALPNIEQGISTISYEYATPIPAAPPRVVQIANFPEVYQQLLGDQCFQFCSIVPNTSRGGVALLACPIFDATCGLLGDLWLINHKDHAFNELEIQLVQQVATQCAIAIRTARLYQASVAQVEELEKLNQLKDDFLSTVSHELRTPVSNMKMAIHMLLTAPAGEARERYLQVLHQECTREIELINNLLDLQRLEADSSVISSDVISLQDWLPEMLKPFQLRTQSHQQRLRVEFPASLQSLKSTRASLGRVLTELLNNAYKYTPSSGEIVLSVRQNEALATIFTISNCAEIPAAELSHIFEKFYRVPNGNPWRQSGTGLGLALVQNLVEELQGTIFVESGEGWTTFTVELPNQPSSE